jgi:hypothetical protein
MSQIKLATRLPAHEPSMVGADAAIMRSPEPRLRDGVGERAARRAVAAHAEPEGW